MAGGKQATTKRTGSDNTPKRGRGRPRKPVDEKLISDLARIHCTVDEIASIAGVSRDTLDRNYAELIENGKRDGKASLRRVQYKAAVDGNPTMMIWLGKNLLQQSDKIEQKTETTVTVRDERAEAAEIDRVLGEIATASVTA